MIVKLLPPYLKKRIHDDGLGRLEIGEFWFFRNLYTGFRYLKKIYSVYKGKNPVYKEKNFVDNSSGI